jgi:hypothetical protein
VSKSQQIPTIPLPKSWNKQVRSAVLHVLSLAQYAAVYSRGWAADSTNTRVRLKAELDRPSNGCCPSPAILYNPFGWWDRQVGPPKWGI